jgi:integrase
MAPQPQGGIAVETQGDGTLAFRLRFRAYGKRRTAYLHERRDCDCGCGGGWNERTAAVELENVLARVKAGVWEPPKRAARADKPVDTGAPLFVPYSSGWLQAKIDGVNGEKPISKNTEHNYRWRLQCHLVPFFTDNRVDEIDRQLCMAFKAHLLKQSRELREAIEAGADLRDGRGQKLVPLSACSIRKVIDTLAALLDEAVEDDHIDFNPARGKRMRVHVPKPKRTFLEIDELAALIDAATGQDISLTRSPAPIELGLTAAQVAHLHGQGKAPKQIAKQLGLAKSTVSYHLSQLGLKVGRGYVGRRVVVEILGRGGPRASELCDTKIGHVRLHDPDGGARFQIPDAKTETGIREVQMSPDLAETVVEHIDRLRRIGAPTGPEDYLVPNLKGRRMDYGRVEQIIHEAAERASEQLTERGMPPLPHTTPHTLRRTYISIALLANNFDVKWVMSQVGHADSKMTLDVYAQLEQRAKRDHGANFDKLIRNARKDLAKSSDGASNRVDWDGDWDGGPKSTPKRRARRVVTSTKTRRYAGHSPMEPAGLEPATSCLQSRGGYAGTNGYGGLASAKVVLLLAKMTSAVLKAVLAATWYSCGTLRDRWLLTASKAAVIQPARS